MSNKGNSGDESPIESVTKMITTVVSDVATALGTVGKSCYSYLTSVDILSYFTGESSGGDGALANVAILALLCLVITSLISTAIYVLSTIVFREKTFEEALEEQKHKREGLFGHVPKGKKSKVQKSGKNKPAQQQGQATKEKEKDVNVKGGGKGVSTDEPDTSAPAVEVKSEITKDTVAPSLAAPPTKSKGKEKKAKKVAIAPTTPLEEEKSMEPEVVKTESWVCGTGDTKSKTTAAEIPVDEPQPSTSSQQQQASLTKRRRVSLGSASTIVSHSPSRSPTRSNPSTPTNTVIKPILKPGGLTPSNSASEESLHMAGTVSNHFEETKPLDDHDLKTNVGGKRKGGKLETVEAEIVPEEQDGQVSIEKMIEQSSAQQQQQSKAKKSGKSGKVVAKSKSEDSADGAELNFESILNNLQRCKLDSVQVQTLVETLLSGSHAAGSLGHSAGHLVGAHEVGAEDHTWINKSRSGKSGETDPAQLKKQLETVNTQLQLSQDTVATLQAKLKVIRNELGTEKNSMSTIKRRYEEQLQTKSNEITHLTSRISQMRDTVSMEILEHQQKITNLQNMLKAAREESGGLKQALQGIEQVSKCKSEQTERETEALRTQSGHLENQLKAAFQSNQEMTNQNRHLQELLQGEQRKLNELKNETDRVKFDLKTSLEALNSKSGELNQLHGQITSNDMRVKTLQGEIEERKSTHSRELKELHSQLQASKSTLDSNQSQMKSLESKLSTTETNLVNSNKEKDNLKSTVSSLEAKVESLEKAEKVAENATSAKSDQSEAIASLKAQVTQLETQVEAKESTIGQLHVENLNVKNQFDQFKSDLNTMQESNGTLRDRNRALNEQINEIEGRVGKAISERSSLESKISALEKSLQKSQTEQTSQESTFRATLEKLLGKIDEISGDEQLKPMNKTIDLGQLCQTAVDRLAIIVPAKKSANNIQNNGDVVSPESNGDPKISQQLQAEVEHYKTVLKETETLLSSLQTSIESEEISWKKKLEEKNAEVAELTAKLHHQENLNKQESPGSHNVDVQSLTSITSSMTSLSSASSLPVPSATTPELQGAQNAAAQNVTELVDPNGKDGKADKKTKKSKSAVVRRD